MITSKQFVMGLILAMMLALSITVDAAPPMQTDDPETVTLVGNFQSQIGCPAEWDPTCVASQLNPRRDGIRWEADFILEPGDYEYKVAINGSWAENYGANGVRDGANVAFSLDSRRTVRFQYIDTFGYLVSDFDEPALPNADGIFLPTSVTLSGTFQNLVGCETAWMAECIWTEMVDVRYGLYSLEFELYPGTYEYKIALNGSWDNSYGPNGLNGFEDNYVLTIDEPTIVDFTYDHFTGQAYDSVRTPEYYDPSLVVRDAPPVPAGEEYAVLVGSFQTQNGCPANDDPTCEATRLTKFGTPDDTFYVGAFWVPAGQHFFNILLNGAIPLNEYNGGIVYGEVRMNNPEDQIVVFYYWPTGPAGYESSQNFSAFYSRFRTIQPEIDQVVAEAEIRRANAATETVDAADTTPEIGVRGDTYATVVGSFQTVLGCPADKDVECTITDMTLFEDGVRPYYLGVFYLPAGEYTYNISYLGRIGTQGQNGGMAMFEIPIVLESDQWVVFRFDPERSTVLDSINSPGFQASYGLEDNIDALIVAQGGDVAEEPQDNRLSDDELQDLVDAGIDPEELDDPDQRDQYYDYLDETGQSFDADPVVDGRFTPIGFGESLNGQLDDFGTAVFAFAATEGQTVQVGLIGSGDLPILSIFYNDEQVALDFSLAGSLRYTAENTGSYEIFLLGENPGQRFTLTLSLIADQPASPTDFILESGDTVSRYWNRYNEFLNSGDEPNFDDEATYIATLSDVYTIDLLAGQRISISIESDEFTPVVFLRDPSTSGFSEPINGAAWATETGTYSLYVTNEELIAGGYTMTVNVIGDGTQASIVEILLDEATDGLTQISERPESINPNSIWRPTLPVGQSFASWEFGYRDDELMLLYFRSTEFPATIALYQRDDGGGLLIESPPATFEDGAYTVILPVRIEGNVFYRATVRATDGADNAAFEFATFIAPVVLTDAELPSQNVLSTAQNTGTLDDNGMSYWVAELSTGATLNVSAQADSLVSMALHGPRALVLPPDAPSTAPNLFHRAEVSGRYVVVVRGEPGASFSISSGLPVEVIDNVFDTTPSSQSIIYEFGVSVNHPVGYEVTRLEPFTHQIAQSTPDGSQSPLQLFVQFSIDEMYIEGVSNPPYGYVANLTDLGGDFAWKTVEIDGKTIAVAELLDNGEAFGAIMARQINGGFYLLGFGEGATNRDWATGREIIFSTFASITSADNATLIKGLPQINVDPTLLPYRFRAGSLTYSHLVDVEPEFDLAGSATGFFISAGTSYNIFNPASGSVLYLYDYSNDEFGPYIMQRLSVLIVLPVTEGFEDEWVNLNGRPAMITRSTDGLFNSFNVTVRLENGQLATVGVYGTDSPDDLTIPEFEAFILTIAASIE